MQSPGVGWLKLTFLFTAGDGVPELRGDEETAKGLDAAGIDLGGIGFWARKKRCLKCAGVIKLALVGVDLCECSARKQSHCSDLSEATHIDETRRIDEQRDQPYLRTYLAAGFFLLYHFGHFFTS
jgi:hypothetical protein